MRLPDMWEDREGPTISFEVFPAKTEKGRGKLLKVIDKLCTLAPNFISVTFGAGGSTREGSYELVKVLKQKKGLDVLPYFACVGLGPDQIVSVIDAYRELGVTSLLAVRGDVPLDIEAFEAHPDSLAHASDLILFLQSKYNLSIGAAGYPEGHIAQQSKEKDLEFLKLKVDCGAEFIIANYCYNTATFFDFVKNARKTGIDVPIVPGIMPIFNVKTMRHLAGLCGATITKEIEDALLALREGDKGALSDFGIEFATRQCRELVEFGVPALHFYTMNKSKAVKGIVGNLRAEGLLGS